MAYTPKPGDVSAFKNDKKGNEKAPDFRGTVIAHRAIQAGEKLDLALWTKTGTNGGWFYSGKISDPRKPKEDAGSKSSVDDDHIPFAPQRD